MKKIRAIGYIRQSDEREDKEDISEQMQLAKIQQYCDFNNWELVTTFKDIDYSGFRIRYTKRPGIMEAIKFAKDNNIDKFVIYNLSRLTRLRKDFILIQESLESIGVDICSTVELLDFGSPTGRLVAGILVNFNEYFSDNLSDVTMDAKRSNAEKGRWNGGPAPFGLKRNGDVFVADTDLAISDGIVIEKHNVVRKFFEIALNGRGPYLAAKWAKENGVKTETGVDWTQRRVRYVLTNPTYAGMQKWEEKHYPLNGFETLVSWEDFLYIQDTLFGKEKAWRGKNRHMLSSVLRCPVCGGKMHSRQNPNGRRRYVCSVKNDPGGCSSAVIDQISLDEAIINLISDISKKRYSKDSIITNFPRQDDQGNEIKRLHQEYDRLEQAKQKVFDDYYIHQRLQENQFNTLMKRYEDRQKEIQEKLNKIPMPNKKYGDIDRIMNELGKIIDKLDDQEKRTLVELIIEKIIPNKETEIHFRWGEVIKIPVKRITRRRSYAYYYTKKDATS